MIDNYDNVPVDYSSSNTFSKKVREALKQPQAYLGPSNIYDGAFLIKQNPPS